MRKFATYRLALAVAVVTVCGVASVAQDRPPLVAPGQEQPVRKIVTPWGFNIILPSKNQPFEPERNLPVSNDYHRPGDVKYDDVPGYSLPNIIEIPLGTPQRRPKRNLPVDNDSRQSGDVKYDPHDLEWAD